MIYLYIVLEDERFTELKKMGKNKLDALVMIINFFFPLLSSCSHSHRCPHSTHLKRSQVVAKGSDNVVRFGRLTLAPAPSRVEDEVRNHLDEENKDNAAELAVMQCFNQRRQGSLTHEGEESEVA